MSISFTLNRILYFLSHDTKVEVIEEILHCQVVNQKGFYYPRFTSYLIKNNCDLSKLQQLENTLKCHIEVKYEDYNYILKCYYRYELPSFIPFSYKPTNEICLGESYNGRFKISFNQYTNIIIGGTTGSGKSNLIASILLNLNCDKLYLDLKGGADNPLLDYIEVITDIYSCIDKLYEINDLIESRLATLRANKNAKLKRLIVVVDELYPILLLKEKKDIYNLIGKMLSRCRVAKVNFILCSQRITSEIIPTLITANIDVRIAMKTASAQESINILGTSDAFYIKESGVGIVNLNGSLKRFKAYYVDENKISDYLPKLEQDTTIANTVEDVKIESDVPSQDDVIYFN